MAKTKKQQFEEKIIKLVGAGDEVEIETVDFSDPNRPKTVLEVDFPILPVNQVAVIEGNAGKPIYQMSKWWARRRSSVFRSMLLAAAMKAPDDPINAAKSVWDVYYANHQKNGALKHLKVADIFMGGGTTLVEGSRLGMQMYGNDLNPVAWLVVKNELANVDIDEVKRLSEYIELEVKPQIMPYNAVDCPRGHQGKWLKFESIDVPIKPYYDNLVIIEPTEKDLKNFKESINTFDGWKNWYQDRGYYFELMGEQFNPFLLSNQERSYYRYWGPEIIYTFWAKHGPCQSSGCGHRTPIMTTPVLSVKELTVKVWADFCCEKCGEVFDIEEKAARMAPSAPLVVAKTEKKFSSINIENTFECPSCKNKQSSKLLDRSKQISKKVSLTLLVHKLWTDGLANKNFQGQEYGGCSEDSIESTISWNNDRAKLLRLIEVRGTLPEQIVCPDTGITIETGSESGSNKGKGKFVCAACGMKQQFTKSLTQSEKDAPIAHYAIHGYCPTCDHNKEIYNGRFFDKGDTKPLNYALVEWRNRKDNDLINYWPESKIPFGHETHQRQDFDSHGYSHWWKMFNYRQLLILSQLLKSIINTNKYSNEVRELLLGSFQQYTRNQNTFCIWNAQRDTPEPHFSNNNYYPKSNFVENSVFSDLGRGNWNSSISALLEGMEWKLDPYELISKDHLNKLDSELAETIKSKSIKIKTRDPVINSAVITNGSSTALSYADGSIDLIITDPPFGDNVQYSELSDFFYVWLEKALNNQYPNIYNSLYVPKALEAVSNRARHPGDADDFYKRLLTECWKEAERILKPGGILAFTFHHSEDEPWVAVLESLFDAGFYLEATYPIRSDESKGENAEFGSKKIEYDIIHVCRKRTFEPESISWARLRRQMLKDIRQIQSLLENHLQSGLTESDLQVVKRGKALEYFSKHYGKVFVGDGREFTVREALIGINQLLNDENDSNVEPPPVEAEVLTRQFLRIFNKTVSIQRNEMQNYLRGTGVSSDEFEDKMWCKESNRIFEMTSPLEFAREWKEKTRKSVSFDLDQVLFLIGACFENSGINVTEVLSLPDFNIHPPVISLLDWFKRNGGNSEIKNAAIKAHRICVSFIERHPDRAPKQLDLFDLD